MTEITLKLINHETGVETILKVEGLTHATAYHNLKKMCKKLDMDVNKIVGIIGRKEGI